jgi:4-aminobutyrate aminotransferase-like enzyme
MPAVKSIAKENDALLVSDEMICGFGRTGKWFGCEHSGVVPDVVTMGKGLGNGFPVSGLASTEEITKAKPWGAPSGSSSSYGGNPMAGAAILASVTVIEEEKLVENAERVGAFMLRRFREMQERYPFIGDVRGKGLLIGVELVKDRTTKEALAKDVCVRLFRDCLEHGLVSMVYTPSFRVNPPLTIDEETADTALGILDEAFARLAREGSWQ